MRILFIANSRIPTERAMGTAIMKQCEAFAKDGHTVTLVVPKRKNSLRTDPFLYHGVQQNFTIVYLQSCDASQFGNTGLRFFIQKLSFFLALSRYVWTSDADILYSREPELIGSLITSKPRFVEIHHLYGLRFFGRVRLSRCVGIITITNALKEDIVNRFSLLHSRVCVAPSGVDVASFKHFETKGVARTRLAIVTSVPVAMYIGEFDTWKGATIFFESARNQKLFKAVVIGGKDAEVEVLRKRYPWVHFLGRRPQTELPSNQQAADVLVVPNSGKEVISARHTSPLKVFAHMTSGIPVVASNTHSISEILSSKNAILVTPDNPEALREGILCAINDTVNSATIAQQARIDVLLYDWNVRTKNIISHINDCTRKINR